MHYIYNICTLTPIAEPKIVAMWNNVFPLTHLESIVEL